MYYCTVSYFAMFNVSFLFCLFIHLTFQPQFTLTPSICTPHLPRLHPHLLFAKGKSYHGESNFEIQKLHFIIIQIKQKKEKHTIPRDVVKVFDNAQLSFMVILLINKIERNYILFLLIRMPSSFPRQEYAIPLINAAGSGTHLYNVEHLSIKHGGSLFNTGNKLKLCVCVHIYVHLDCLCLKYKRIYGNCYYNYYMYLQISEN